MSLYPEHADIPWNLALKRLATPQDEGETAALSGPERRKVANRCQQERAELVRMLKEMLAVWKRYGPALATVSGKPTTIERAEALLVSLEGK